MPNLIFKNRINGKKYTIKFSSVDISKEVADKLVEDFHQQNPEIHFALSIISALIVIHYETIDANKVESTALYLSQAVSILMVAFPDVFDKEIEFSYYNRTTSPNSGQLILHSGGILDKYLAYEIIASTRRN